MNIGIIGAGVVGSAVGGGLQQIGQNVMYYDIKLPDTRLEDLVGACEIIYICVPTPSTDQGACDVSNVVATVAELDSLDYTGLIAIKSTVIPGTTQALIDQYPRRRICFVPEFLREKSALSDFIDNHDVLIVGTHSQTDYELIVRCHGDIPKKTIKIEPGAAEMSKYFSNVFNSLRVVFANGIYEVCKKLNINYQDVLSAISNKATVGKHYLRCDRVYRGYGGACLPKDTEAFLELTRQLDLEHLKLFSAIVEDNRYHTK